MEASTIDPSISEYSLPTISHTNRDIFGLRGNKFLSTPSLEEFLVEAGITSLRTFRAMMKSLEFQGINTIDGLMTTNKSQLLQLLEGNLNITNKIFNHLLRIKFKGSILLHAKELEQLEKEYYYLEIEKDIDKILFRHVNEKHGIRSKSLIEICGPDGVGKTQWCITATSSMLQVGKKVVYVDSDGGFNYHRITQIANDSKLSKRSIKDNIIVANIDTFDELDAVLTELSGVIKEQNIGMIVIDSLMQLLQNSYPITSNRSLDSLAERQLHLRRVMRRLRSLARNHNLVIIYTNLTRDGQYSIPLQFTENEVDEEQDDLATLTKLIKRMLWVQSPMGGPTLAQSSDLRLFLGKIHNDSIKYKALVENCAYLPRISAEYIITEAGIKLYDSDHKEESTDHIDNLNKILG